MSQIDMKELHATINKQSLKRMELYDSILKKCHSRILYNSGLQRTYCFYQIPEFVIGTPLYDVLELRNYIMNSLKTNGFDILYIDPNWLFIYWNVKGAKSLTKNTNVTKQVKNQYKSTDTYKPTGNFIYDDSSLMNMTDKFKI
tara:strand:+ start:3368 stop:3796 length:429 start_codon:yes stop_codon:yes gene_type:complete